MKAVVLLSGGIDSTVLMYALIAKYEVWPLTINYGQRHVREVVAARMVCGARGGGLLQRLLCIDLGDLGRHIGCTLHGQGDVAQGPYNAENVETMVSPNRNMILLSIAAGYAQSIGAERVAYAAHSNDGVVYPDCRPEFVEAVGEALCFGTGGKVQMFAPFISWCKSDIVTFGRGLNVPFAKTYSCYEGNELHCGTCPTCLDRQTAFEIADVEDPTRYESPRFEPSFEMKGQW